MKLKELKDEQFIKEMCLMTLSYRISPSNLAKLLKTTEDDVMEMIYYNPEIYDAMERLIEETRYEEETTSKWSYYHASEYFKKRNSIVKEIKELSKADDKALKAEKVAEFKKHLSLVDNTKIREIISITSEKPHKRLTEEQKDEIAKYKLKFGLSDKRTAMTVHKTYVTVKECVEGFVEKNPIYAVKFAILEDHYKDINNKFKGGRSNG